MIARQEPVPVTLFADGQRDDFRWYSGDRAATDFVFFHIDSRGVSTEIHPRKIWEHDHIGGSGHSVFRWIGRNGAPLPKGEAIKIEPIPLKITTAIVAGKLRARFRHGGRHAKDIVLVLPDGREISEPDFKFDRRASHGILIYPRAGVGESLPEQAEVVVELSPTRTLTDDETKAREDAAKDKSKENNRAAALNVWQESPRRGLHVQCAGEILGPERCLEFENGIPKLWYDDPNDLQKNIRDWVGGFVHGSRRVFFRDNDQPAPLSIFDEVVGSRMKLETLLLRSDLYCRDKKITAVGIEPAQETLISEGAKVSPPTVELTTPVQATEWTIRDGCNLTPSEVLMFNLIKQEWPSGPDGLKGSLVEDRMQRLRQVAEDKGIRLKGRSTLKRTLQKITLT